jgi:hypothetical protein
MYCAAAAAAAAAPLRRRRRRRRRRLDVVEYYIEVDYCVEYFVDFSWSVYEKK